MDKKIKTKMSSSVPDGMIALDDHPFTIREKMRTAFCPLTVEDNPTLLIAKHCILEVWTKGLQVEDIIFKSYDELEKAFLVREISPSDLKFAIAEALIKILEPVRRKIG